MVRLLQGDVPTYYGINDGEGNLCGQARMYYCERQAFLLGSKVDAELGKGPAPDFLLMIAALRNRTYWWQRGMVYKDTIGVDNRHTDVLDVRRHDDHNGKIVLVVDNAHNYSGLAVGFEGVMHGVEAAPLSVIEVNQSRVLR